MRRPPTEGIELRRLDPRWQALQSRIVLALWLVILGVPAAIFIALNLQQPRLDPAQVEIGDPVFDDFIRVLERDGGLRVQLNSNQPLHLSEAAWQDLASRHPGNPRLYELLFHLQVGRQRLPYWDFREALQREQRALEAAGNTAEKGLRLQLRDFKSRYNSWIANAERMLESQEQGRKSQAESLEVWSQLVHAKAYGDHEAEATADLARLEALAPEDAGPCYYAAWLHCRRGDWPAAAAAFARGNARPRCTMMVGCPLDTYHQRILEGQPPRDSLVGACLAQMESSGNTGDQYALQLTFQAALNHCIQHEDRALLAEMYIALCRSAGRLGQNHYDSRLCCSQIEEIAQALAAAGWSTGNSAAVNRLSRETSALTAHMRMSMPNWRSSRYWGQGRGAPLQVLIGQVQQRLATFSGNGPEAALYQDSLAWNGSLAPGRKLHSILRDLEQFDCRSLSWRGSKTTATPPP